MTLKGLNKLQLIETLSYMYRSVLDYFFKKANPINIMTIDETLNYIIENKCCVARYGDGEFKLMFDEYIGFQDVDASLKNDLIYVLQNHNSNCLVCLPGAWKHEKLYTKGLNKYWKNHLLRRRKQYYSVCSMGYLYGNSEMTRCYLGIKDKSTVPHYFALNRSIWDNKDVLIVEGDKSRLGVGNDLLDNCKSIKRILCPAINAYEKIDEIYEEIKKFSDKNNPILVALGPTATVLCHKLSLENYFAIDVGNMDKEYEWYKCGATQKQINPIKHMVEIPNDGIVQDCLDEKYLSEIVCKIE